VSEGNDVRGCQREMMLEGVRGCQREMMLEGVRGR